MCDQQSLRAFASDKSLEYSMIVKLLTEHHLEFLSLKGGYRDSSEPTLVKMSNCWNSHALAQMVVFPRHGLKMVQSEKKHILYKQRMTRYYWNRIMSMIIQVVTSGSIQARRGQIQGLFKVSSFQEMDA